MRKRSPRYKRIRRAGGPRCWRETQEDLEEHDVPYTADVEGLRRFIETELLPFLDDRRRELANRPLIRDQAFGEALDPDKLERLGRYEVHLDRKLERTLSMLLKLKQLRSGPAEP